MKRGKHLNTYFFSIVFGCLFLLFASNSKVSAIDEVNFSYSCIDTDTSSECDNSTLNAYYKLDKIIINDASITKLEIPSTYDDGENGVKDVEIIASNAIETSENLALEELVLPTNLKEIKSNAFTSISSLSKVTIPTSVSSIESHIFSDNCKIDAIYLNHYRLTNYEFVEIDENAFSNADVDKIICQDHSVYNYYLTNENSNLKNAPVVSMVTYNYYSYENEELTDLNTSKDYYIGNNQIIEEIPNDLEIEGLTFLGWYLKDGSSYTKINSGDTVKFVLYTTVYSIYPKFSLNEVTFNITSTDHDGKSVSSARYEGTSDLIKLSINNLSHVLKDSDDFNYSVSWKKESNLDNSLSSDDYICFGLVEESGDYRAIVSYSYTYNGTEYTNSTYKTKTITITKAPLYIVVSNASKTYGEYLNQDDISYTTNGLLGNDEITMVEYNYPNSDNSGNIAVGSYANKIKIEVESIVDDDKENKMSNYDLVYAYGTYTVTSKSIDAYFDESDSFELEYGDEIIIAKTYSMYDVYGKYDVTVTVYFAKEPGIKVGSYQIIGVSEIDNSNYEAIFNSESTIGTVTITAKKIATAYSLDSSTYDGNVKEFSAYYKDINNVTIEVPYIIYKNGSQVSEIKDAGSYRVDITSLEDTNYTFIDNSYRIFNITIAKATPVATYSEYQIFTYSGVKINPIISIDNDEQQPIYTCMSGGLQGDYCINSGSYNVIVTYNESANYNQLVTSAINLSISKYYINLSPKSFTFYYGETIDASEELLINGEKVLIKYDTSATSSSEIGSYDIVRATVKNINNGADHQNYIASLLRDDSTDKVKIVARPITLVYYNYDGLVYNGKEREIGVYAIDYLNNKVVTDLNLSIVCDEGTIKDAKTYHLRAYFDNDHYQTINSNLLEFSISKSSYNLSNITFENASYTLDFKKHSISIKGVLPEGVSVSYTIDGKEGNATSRGFTHTVVASFTIDSQNYYSIDDMEASIYIDVSWVFITIALLILVIAIALSLALLYARYRRLHPRKIKLKIKNVVKENLDAKRVATSVKEVLGDEKVEIAKLEDEDDLPDDVSNSQTFIEKIYASDSELKYYYSEVKNELLSYEGVTHSLDRKYEVFYHGTRQIAKLSICNNILRLYVNLDPSKYDKEQYNHRDMSKFECHARTPLRIEVNTQESLRHAKVFIRIVRKRENLRAVSSFVRIDYEKFYTLKENVFPKIFKKMFSINNKNKK